ncbi:acetoin dehydrogenase E2 subunit dihydrolipoyllysine-residue acetyltransferase [Nocardia otitidiscaviarum]|uniref:Acetoin dehydrogenase E2 subunit dihydrolipoyllysine-residue acetyltransferase n=1 Tax=Nocardia otitidiscaviarum TaxID=1823 RepID=A0A378YD63_9NOCA|nr:alpha/beta fold hydrolase [Nocardia otitidiscaviarum]SUA75126.1 acetoin dehydrogenase E2 subunit dihydrolipoyllysine-residue acetyltransferase [Nocardia otitidiscaviarum]
MRNSAFGMPTFVFVHGSGTSSSMWTPIQRELALRGQRCLAVDLPGHGFEAQFPIAYQAPQQLDRLATEPSALAAVTLEDNADAVRTVVERVHEYGPVVLVGASLGGTSISVVANQVPDLLDRIVYISAWACTTLTNPIEYMSEPEFTRSLLPGLADLNVGDAMELGVGRANYRGADRDQLARLHAALMADRSEQEFLAFLNALQPDESLAAMMGDARLHPDLGGQVRRQYVRLIRDRSLPIDMQDRLIAEADAATPGNHFEVDSLDTSHAGFVYHPETVAKLLIR